MDREQAKAKIAKLMAMANDGRGNEFESETALRQAEKLMLQHGIDQADLAARNPSAKAIYEWRTVLIPCRWPRPLVTWPTWLNQLGLGIARFTDCKATLERDPKYGTCLAFSGEVQDVEYAAWLAKYLRDDARRTSESFAGTRRECEDFRRAYVSRVIDRMAELRAQREESLRAHVTTSGCTALVVVNQKIALRDERFGAQSIKKTGHRSMNGYAMEQGRKAGDRAHINRPVGGPTQRTALK